MFQGISSIFRSCPHSPSPIAFRLCTQPIARAPPGPSACCRISRQRHAVYRQPVRQDTFSVFVLHICTSLYTLSKHPSQIIANLYTLSFFLIPLKPNLYTMSAEPSLFKTNLYTMSQNESKQNPIYILCHHQRPLIYPIYIPCHIRPSA